MSVVDKELIYDDAVQSLGDDRPGLVARLVYIATLANSHVTASDGTLPFSPGVVKQQLVPGVTLLPDEIADVQRRLLHSMLLVAFESGGRPYALVRAWWRYNTRPDRATRAARNPLVPREVLDTVPEFAAIYDQLPGRGDSRRPKRTGGGKSREKPGQRGTIQEASGHAGKARAPDPVPEPEADTAPAGVHLAATPVHRAPTVKEPSVQPNGTSDFARVVLPVVNRFEKAFATSFRRSYPTTHDDQLKVLEVWRELPPAQQGRLPDDVELYFGQSNEPTLGGFCEWRRERSRRRVEK